MCLICSSHKSIASLEVFIAANDFSQYFFS